MRTKTRLELRAGRCERRKDCWHTATGTLSSWLREARKFSVLGRDEEKELAALARKGDLEARNELIIHNLRLAIWAAQYFDYPPGVQFDDVIQEGILGLIHAAGKYDEEMDITFAGYALYWIEGTISAYLCRCSAAAGLMEMPSNTASMIQRIRKIKEAAYKETGDPHISGWELRRNLNASDGLIDKALAYAEADVITDEDAQYGIPDDYPGTEELAVSHVFQEECLDVLATLPEKEADVLCRRNGFPPYTKAYTLEDIGKAYGVSRERIRQIEAKAYRRLRRPERLRKLRC